MLKINCFTEDKLKYNLSNMVHLGANDQWRNGIWQKKDIPPKGHDVPIGTEASEANRASERRGICVEHK